jgi:hypothetical protein
VLSVLTEPSAIATRQDAGAVPTHNLAKPQSTHTQPYTQPVTSLATNPATQLATTSSFNGGYF